MTIFSFTLLHPFIHVISPVLPSPLLKGLSRNIYQTLLTGGPSPLLRVPTLTNRPDLKKPPYRESSTLKCVIEQRSPRSVLKKVSTRLLRV